jgi:hypothetical protein
MRKVLAVLFTLMIALSMSFIPVSASEGPQRVFDVTMMVQVSQTQINGSLAWVGAFDIYVKLVDPNYRAYFDDLAKKNETEALREFANFVYNLVYNNLKDDLNDRLEGSNVSAIIYVPAGGPVHVTGNWSAVVRFSVVPFLIPNGQYLVCPFYGSLDFVSGGKVYSFAWKRLTMVFHQGYRIRELVPKPSDFSSNVAVWENGDYIPYVELYNPVYLFGVFINSTEKEINVSFNPVDGYVQFNATFTGMKVPQSVVDILLTAFRQRMNIMSISAKELSNGVEVIGVAKPEVAYRETRKEKIWLVSVRLPGRFDRIVIRGGKYTVAPDGTLIITYTEKKRDYLPYAIVLSIVAILLGVVLWRRRKAQKEKPEEVSNASEKVETIEIGEDEE